MATTENLGLPTGGGGLVALKNAFKRAMGILDVQVQAALDAAGVGENPATYAATAITYDNGTSGLAGDSAQEALDELADRSTIPAFVIGDAGKVLTVTDVGGVATLAWVTPA